ncbi:MAG: M50 family metallopeptidase [Peptococcaceae bacterium]|nr:M50 family metallopeptidase [Peptococcaceae bacterium]
MRICHISGIGININNWFLALLGLYFVAGVLGKGMIAFAVVFFHELAHVLAARKLGVRVSEAELMPFGGVAKMSNELTLDPAKEIIVAAAGPLTNLALFFGAIGLGHHGIWHEEYGPFFIQCNIMLFLFNLLPGLPLDGGRVWRAYLIQRGVNLPVATHKMAGWGQFWGAVMVFLGVLGVIYHVCGLDIVATGLFLFYAATREKKDAPYLYAQHLLAKQKELFHKGILPVDILVSLQDTPAWKVIRNFTPQRFHFVYLVDRQGNIVSTLDENVVVQAVIEHGATISMGRVKEGFPK